MGYRIRWIGTEECWRWTEGICSFEKAGGKPPAFFVYSDNFCASLDVEPLAILIDKFITNKKNVDPMVNVADIYT